MAALGRLITVTCRDVAEVKKIVARVANEKAKTTTKGLVVTIVYDAEEIVA